MSKYTRYFFLLLLLTTLLPAATGAQQSSAQRLLMMPPAEHHFNNLKFNVLGENQPSSNFESKTLAGFSVRGNITNLGLDFVGLTVKVAPTGTVNTAVDCVIVGTTYSCNNLLAGESYTITPSFPNSSFNPSSRVYSNIQADFTNQNFTAITNQRFISGFIRVSSNVDVTSLTVIAENSTSSGIIITQAVTKLCPIGSVPFICYQVPVLPNSLVRVIPRLPGAVFTPASRNFPFPIINDEFGLPSNAIVLSSICTYSLSESRANVTDIGTSGSFSVNTPSDCARYAVSNAPWLIVPDNARGFGSNNVNYVVQRNYGEARSASIFVNGQIFTVNQAAGQPPSNRANVNSPDAPCAINSTVDSSGQNRIVVPFTGTGNGSFNVNTQSNCQWTAVADKSWITVNTPSGSGIKSANFSVELYGGNIPRSGTIAVNGIQYTVVQTAKQLTECNYALDRNTASYPFGVAEDTFDIVGLSPTCRWAVFAVDSPWVNLIDGFSFGLGPGTAKYKVGVNNGTVERTGTIVVGDKAIAIDQAAGTAADCNYQLSTAEQTLAAAASSAGNFTVTSGTGCRWQARTTTPWITITGGEGTGTGTVSFTTNQTNSEPAPRTGTITVGGKSFTVTQNSSQQACSYTIDPGFQKIDKTGAAGRIKVSTSSSCTTPVRNIISNAGWILIAEGAFGSNISDQVSFIAQTNETGADRIGTISINGLIFTITQSAGEGIAPESSSRLKQFDFDGDGKSDVSVYRPGNGVWYQLNSLTGFTAAQFGIATDKITPADFDGDGKTDIAVFREGTWFLQRSREGFTSIPFGSATDIPAPADFDGDGQAELAVFRPSNGVWYSMNLLGNAVSAVQFGASEDKPVTADFDKDGRADQAVYRPSNGVWYMLGSTKGFSAVQFGNATDKPVVGDYDGDGQADQAVYRPSNGTWYILGSTNGFSAIQFGIATDITAPGDFDADGKTDIAVFRPENGTWYQMKSKEGFGAVQFGANGDKPIPNAFVP